MIRVIAVAAPHWVAKGHKDISSSLNSTEPYSLYNAIRLAAYRAQQGDGSWGQSNWRERENYQDSIMLYEYFEDQKAEFLSMLERQQPNLIFIGSMTLSFAGAIRIAEIAKERFPEAFIVLGGKHVIETTYLVDGKIATNANCPLSLMTGKKIPAVFDLLVSGDGEELVVEIGNLIDTTPHGCSSKEWFIKHAGQLKSAGGQWIAGWLSDSGVPEYIESTSILDQDILPSPIAVFGVKSSFPVFNADLTAHTYSYLSKGCLYDCYFCSERIAINGKYQQKQTGANRLLMQFKELQEIAVSTQQTVSAFVEDSILLGGQVKLLNSLSELLEAAEINIPFGGQFTFDLLSNKEVQDSIKRLAKQGFSYVFTGLETNNNDIATQMSKNRQKGKSWLEKSEDVLSFLSDCGIRTGFSILFGLGETQQDRLLLLDLLEIWQRKFGAPEVISLNYATQHPLQRYSEIKSDYIDWGTAMNSPYLPYFTSLFGEASEIYPIPNTELCSISELEEIKQRFSKFKISYQ